MPVPAAAVTSTTLPVSSPWPSISFGRDRRDSSAFDLSGQAEHALGDDVALDLVGAAVDGVRAREQVQPLPFVELAAVEQSGRPCPATSIAISPSSRCQLAHNSFDTIFPGRPAAFHVHGRQRVGPHGLQPDPRPGQPLADQRIVGGAGASWPARRCRKAHARNGSAGRAWTRRARTSACPSRPASRRRAHRPPGSASVRASSKNTSLNSESPVSWTIGRISTPG